MSGSPEAEEGCVGPVDYTVRKLAEKFSVVNMKSASLAAENVFVENEMFIEMSDTNSVHSLWFGRVAFQFTLLVAQLYILDKKNCLYQF